MTNPMLGGRGRGWLHWRVEVGGGGGGVLHWRVEVGGVTLEGRGGGGGGVNLKGRGRGGGGYIGG